MVAAGTPSSVCLLFLRTEAEISYSEFSFEEQHLPDSDLQFFLNEKRYVAVISFVGSVKVSDFPQLSKCLEVVQSLRVRFLVFNCAGITLFEPDMEPALVKLQAAARDGGRQIFLCGLSPDLKKRFEGSGIVRGYELVPSLVEALQKIVGGAVK